MKYKILNINGEEEDISNPYQFQEHDVDGGTILTHRSVMHNVEENFTFPGTDWSASDKRSGVALAVAMDTREEAAALAKKRFEQCGPELIAKAVILAKAGKHEEASKILAAAMSDE